MGNIIEECKNLISDELLDKVWGYADFGKVSKRDIIKNTLLKCASGYYSGHTAKTIVEELGLVTKKWTLTKLGKQYLYEAYSTDKNL